MLSKCRPLWSRGSNLAWRGSLQPPWVLFCSATLVEAVPQKPSIRADLLYSCETFLRLCRDTQDLRLGRLTHDFILENGISEDATICSVLIQMYGKCGSTWDALHIFLACTNTCDVSSYNVILVALARQGLYNEALQLFVQMQQEGILPNKVTFMSIISVCGSLACLLAGKHVHVHIISQDSDSLMQTGIGPALVNMYGKCASMTDTERAFNLLPWKSLIAYTIMMSACAQNEYRNEACLIFGEMLANGVQPDRVAFISILTACSCQIVLLKGMLVHTCILESCLDQEISIVNALISMYGKCFCLHEARKLFDTVSQRDTITWTALITAYSEHGSSDEALNMLESMYKEGFLPNDVTFLSLLSMCASHNDVGAGDRVYDCIIQQGLESSSTIVSAILNMYSKCGDVVNARSIFDRTTEQTVVAWTAIIAAHVLEGQMDEVFKLFHQMENQGVVPNMVTLTNLAEACARMGALSEGQNVHFYIIEKGFDSDILIGTALIKMYSASCSLKDALKVFDMTSGRDQLTWDAIIRSCVDDGQPSLAFELFCLMQREAMLPDEIIFISLLDTCAGKAFLRNGVRLHACTEGIQSNVALGTAIISMYGRCRELDSASNVFDIMIEKNIVSWTSMLSVLVENGLKSRAIQLCEQMLQESVLPNDVTLTIIVSFYTSEEALMEAKRVHARIAGTGFGCDVVLGNGLIAMYGRHGSVENAQRTFDDMPKHDIVSWSTIISVYVQNGRGIAALRLFDQMQDQGFLPNHIICMSVLDACTNEVLLAEGNQVHAFLLDKKLDLDMQIGNCLVHMYGSCGDLNLAMGVFQEMRKKDVISWNFILRGCANQGEGSRACQLFCQMLDEGYTPDEVTHINLLVAFSHSGMVDEASHFLMFTNKEHGQTSTHFTCIVDLLGRAGLLMDVEKLLDCMPFQPTVVPFIKWLGACRYQANVIKAELAVDFVLELEPQLAI